MSEAPANHVLLVEIEGPVWYTIYHFPVVQGVSSNPSIFINQPMGIWDIYVPNSQPIDSIDAQFLFVLIKLMHPLNHHWFSMHPKYLYLLAIPGS